MKIHQDKVTYKNEHNSLIIRTCNTRRSMSFNYGGELGDITIDITIKKMADFIGGFTSCYSKDVKYTNEGDYVFTPQFIEKIKAISNKAKNSPRSVNIPRMQKKDIF